MQSPRHHETPPSGRPLRILLINGSDTKGGAAQVGWSLAHGLRRRGHDVRLVVHRRSSDASFVESAPPDPPATRSASLRSRACHRLGIDRLDLDAAFPRSLGRPFIEAFDVVHLHDFIRFNYGHLPWLGRIRPLAVTLHSMMFFTGNCLYSFDCDRYRRGCGRCPRFGEWPLDWYHRDGSRLNLLLKRMMLARMRLEVVGVSDWITARAAESRVLFGHRVRTIRNAADPARFFPVDREAARRELGIPPDARVVLLAVSGNPRDLRKGLDIARDAIPLVTTPRLFLLPLGVAAATDELAAALGAVPGLPPRHAGDDAALRTCYAAADVVWHPSRAETSSMIALEAMACGTPVIAAPSGGVPEVVDESCALLLTENSPEALAAATDRFFRDPGLRGTLHEEALRRATDGAPFERFLDEHESLYREMADSAAA